MNFSNKKQIIYNNVNQFLTSTNIYNNNLVVIKYNNKTDLQLLFNNFPINILNIFTTRYPTTIKTFNINLNKINKHYFNTFIKNDNSYDFSNEYDFLDTNFLNNIDNYFFIIKFYNSNSKILICSNNVFNHLKNNHIL